MFWLNAVGENISMSRSSHVMDTDENKWVCLKLDVKLLLIPAKLEKESSLVFYKGKVASTPVSTRQGG